MGARAPVLMSHLRHLPVRSSPLASASSLHMLGEEGLVTKAQQGARAPAVLYSPYG